MNSAWDAKKLLPVENLRPRRATDGTRTRNSQYHKLELYH
jgi:hypothetical protein